MCLRTFFRFLGTGVALIPVAMATSVSPVKHLCPVCLTQSVTLFLNSYSHFGEAARDLSDAAPMPQVDVCPQDLYASWSYRWLELDQPSKTKLVEFLKHPAVTLTPEEKKIVAGHEEELRHSPWWRMLWARSCDEMRPLTDQQRFEVTLDFQYTRETNPKGWSKDLSDHYRELAIVSLKDAVAAEWTTSSEKQIYAYLRAELVRKAGRTEEASELFRQVIEAEKQAVPLEDLKWISEWAEEQRGKADRSSARLEEQVASILSAMPDPWRDKSATSLPGWPAHLAALRALSQQAAEGDEEAIEGLWKILDHKPARLLALLETVGVDLSSLRTADPKWRAWFDEIATGFVTGKLQAPFETDPDPQRVIQVLSRVVGPESRDRAWRRSVLQPAVEKALAGRDLPTVDLPAKGSSSVLSPRTGTRPAIPLPTDGEEQESLVDQLAILLDEQPHEQQVGAARMLMRVLHQAEGKVKDISYPQNVVVFQLLKLEGMDQDLARELDGPWKSTFWKAMGEYIARVPGSSAKLANDPLVTGDPPKDESRSFEFFLWEVFAKRADPVWKDRLLQRLKKPDWLANETRYAHALKDAEVDAALERRITLLQNLPRPEGGTNMILYDLRSLERWKVEKRLAEIPIR